jgi:hypothetical protein
MFKPEEIIFAPTARCNLSCRHCRVARLEAELDSGEAVAFMGRCRAAGIERIGYSGGEPFLRQDFLVATARAAVDLDMYFDRLMTNGLWWRDEAELEDKLGALRDAGFDGTVGLSVDAWHEARDERLAAFLAAAFKTWGRKDCAEIVSVRSRDDAPLSARLGSLAAALGGELHIAEGELVAIVNARRRELDSSGRGEDDPEALRITISRIAYSAAPDDAAAWNSGAWFEDDYCAGPGNVFYVHPDGRVAVCCGFANEEPALVVGAIGDSYEDLMARAASSPQVAACYETGLATIRRRMVAAGRAFPGKTRDPCFFCGYLCGERRGND